MTWILLRSTSSCSLVRACAGTPALSPTVSSTLRPASVLLCSRRNCVSPRSMSIPPEARGPVLTVISPIRIGSACARTIAGKPSAEAPRPMPAAWMILLRVNPMSVPPRGCLPSYRTLMSEALRCVGLLERLRPVESVDFHALVEDAHDGRHRRGLDVEISRGKNLAREADIRKRRRVAMAEPAGLAFVREVRLQRFERFSRPVLQPAVARGLVEAHLALEIGADARHDERVAFAGDDQSEPANTGAAARVARQERWLRVCLFEVFENSHRLDQGRAVVDEQ